MNVEYLTFALLQSLYSKQRNAGKSRLSESTLFNSIHKHSFGGLGVDTLTFCESTPFSGHVGGGGMGRAVGFFKG